MYQKSVIYCALLMYKLRHNHSFSISDILAEIKIARSALYEWISLFYSDSFFTDIHFINSKRKLSKTPLNNKKFSLCVIDFIISIVSSNKIISIKKLRKQIFDNFNISISVSYIYRILKNNNLTYKQMQKYKYKIDSEKHKQDIINLKNNIKKVCRNIISIDETSIELGSRPNYGWSEKGKICEFNVTNKRKRYSLILAINKTKVIGYKIIDGTFKTDNFNLFIKENVVPKSKKASLFMDNAVIHKQKN